MHDEIFDNAVERWMDSHDTLVRVGTAFLLAFSWSFGITVVVRDFFC